MQTHNYQKYGLSLQESTQTRRECLFIYKQLKGAKQIRNKLDIPDQEHSFYKSRESKYKPVIEQQLQKLFVCQLANNENCLGNNEALMPPISNESLQNIFSQSSSQISEHEYKITELMNMNQKISETKTQMQNKQSEYKQLMKKHYKFVRPNKPEDLLHKFVKDKLFKNIQNLEHEMQELYEIGGRSSISSSSFGANHAIENWIHQEKQQKIIKQHDKLIDQIEKLQKQLQQLH